MGAVGERLHGRVLSDDNQAALILDPIGGTLLVRYALVQTGSGKHILPETILDDWGHEIRGLQIYSWVRENGPRFPRAEVFGFEPTGSRTQCFMRELELMSRYPCYIYPDEGYPIAAGVKLDAAIIVEPGSAAPRPIRDLSAVPGLLADGQLKWWTIGHEAVVMLDPTFLQHIEP
jgi:hypothetical protein